MKDIKKNQFFYVIKFVISLNAEPNNKLLYCVTKTNTIYEYHVVHKKYIVNLKYNIMNFKTA